MGWVRDGRIEGWMDGWMAASLTLDGIIYQNIDLLIIFRLERRDRLQAPSSKLQAPSSKLPPIDLLPPFRGMAA